MRLSVSQLIIFFNIIITGTIKCSLKKLYFGAKASLIFLFITPVLINFGCWAYSFTGASVPEHLDSIAIPVVEDRSGSGEPGLRESLTDELTQQFINDNTFIVIEKNKADALLVCAIVSLSDAPLIVSAGEQVEARRITISVRAVYKDLVKRKTIYERTFSNYGDYPAGAGIAQRNAAIQDAVENITEDILLETVSGW